MRSFVFGAVIVISMMAIVSNAYKPIIALHGYTGTYLEFDQMKAELEKYQPGHKFFALDIDNKWASMKRLQTLVDDTTNLMKKIISENEEIFRDGFILIGHSQGGIVTRAVMQQNPWNITRYISLAGVQNGFFGDCGIWFGKNLTCEAVTDVLYSKVMQNSFSAAGFWRTPKREKYLKYNLFLPLLDNEEGTAATPEYQKMLKDNFLRTKEYHFFGSPDDGIIRPWYTSVFQTLGTDYETRVPLEDQYIYQHDTFGIRTAVEQGRVHFHEVPGVKHEEWIKGRTDIYYDHLFPLFD